MVHGRSITFLVKGIFTKGSRDWVSYYSLLNSSTMEDKEKLLIDQARNGSELAFNSLYYKYKKRVWRTAYSIVHNADAADDIVSTVFTKVYTRLNTFTEHISFNMWVKTITINTAIDYIRRNKKEHLNNYIDDEESQIQLSRLDNSPEESYIDKQNLDIVYDCIGRLKKKYRDLLTAKINGKSYKELAEEFAMPELTVRTIIGKARKRLRQLFININ